MEEHIKRNTMITTGKQRFNALQPQQQLDSRQLVRGDPT